MSSLGEYIQENDYISKIGIGHNQISDKGIEIISKYLVGNTQISKLDISGNKNITNHSIPFLMEMIKNSAIKLIDFRQTSINNKNELMTVLCLNRLKFGIDIMIFTKSEVNDEAISLISEDIRKYNFKTLKRIE